MPVNDPTQGEPTAAAFGGSFPSGEPSWQVSDLTNLYNQGQLFGVDPVIIGAIAQEESGFEIAGAGYNPEGYGGFFGLGANNYPQGTSETVAQLLDPSEASFIQQAKTAAAEFASLLSSYGNDPVKAESAYQTGSPTAEGAGDGGVALVMQALGGSSPGTGTPGNAPPGSAPGASSSTDSTASAGSAVQGSVAPLQGPANILQTLDNLLNPKAPGTLETIGSLGTANVAQIAQILVIRGFFVLAFLGIGYLGFKTLTSDAPSLPSIPNPLQGEEAPDELAQRRQSTAEANLAQRQAQLSQRTKEQESIQATAKYKAQTQRKDVNRKVRVVRGAEKAAAGAAEAAVL